ncbi:hypothetical protein [Zunongwangia sp. H14]|uniref:hypothetical protein n=1 Tax=Zunongwangia sp. H14 TaxID=3240792 RepID=UPI003565B721
MDSYKPTLYFRTFLSSFPEWRNSFYANIREEYDISVINKSEEYLSYLAPDEEGRTVEIKFELNDSLKRELDKALLFYKKELADLFQQNSIDNINFSTVQKKILYDLKNDYAKTISTYPLIYKYLQKCENHLIHLTQSTDKEDYFDTSLLSNNDIINATFLYLKEENEKGQPIMNHEDHAEMIKMIIQLIEEKKIPELKKKLRLNIPSGLLQFTFWVFHKELKTSKPKRSDILEFLRNVFDALKENSLESLNSSFRNTRFNHDLSYLPPIIKKHLSK